MPRRYRIRYISDLLEFGHSLWASCPACRRSVQLDIRAVIARVGPMLTINELRERVRCTRCGQHT